MLVIIWLIYTGQFSFSLGEAGGFLISLVNHVSIFNVYVWVINVLGLILFGIDKGQAVKGGGRVSIFALFLCGLAGGSLGEILGMFIFRHKTRKPYFYFGLPMILICQVLLYFCLMTVL
ncbi:MAG: DUF1294 domain-containing protein [Lachnospiraceae bacterium]|nr:DUF1294 domain-containing protein [Candidatus Equihabitans merdae]